jgi:hypothetical protein
LLQKPHEIQPFELAAAVEKLAGGDVAVDDATGGVGQYHHQWCGLNDCVEEQLALMQVSH